MYNEFVDDEQIDQYAESLDITNSMLVGVQMIQDSLDKDRYYRKGAVLAFVSLSTQLMLNDGFTREEIIEDIIEEIRK